MCLFYFIVDCIKGHNIRSGLKGTLLSLGYLKSAAVYCIVDVLFSFTLTGSRVEIISHRKQQNNQQTVIMFPGLLSNHNWGWVIS